MSDEQPSKTPEKKPLSPVIKFAILVTAVAVVAVFAFGRNTITDQSPVAGTSPVLPAIEIGGPFDLVDHTGKAVTQDDYKGKFLLVFFGYTFCPDVCPTNLSIVSDALEIMTPEEKEKVQPLFISVDPERDTVELLQEYVTLFHPQMVGLTGTTENIAKVARSYRAFYAKAKESGGDEDYLVDHSATTYLMGPKGEFLTTFSHASDPELVAKGVKKFLSQ
ncbi:MAG: SCO family protein [Rhodospirillales bacterium]|nr:SCO family protein [Rhodospirillales bacterium]